MDGIDGAVRAVADFVGAHRHWAPPVVFLLAFGESLAVVSLLMPATAMLMAVGALIGTGRLDAAPVWLAAVLGATAGDWLSFSAGRWLGGRADHVWPLRRYPAMLARARAFIARWGVASVILGRFVGPLRATVPLAAGICAMPALPFQLANLASAILWATVLLLPGLVGARWVLGTP